MSGGGWSARLEGPSRGLRNRKLALDRAVERDKVENGGKSWRRRSNSGAHGGSRDADRAQIIRMIALICRLAVVRNRRERSEARRAPIRADAVEVEMAERQREVDGKRQKRKP